MVQAFASLETLEAQLGEYQPRTARLRRVARTARRRCRCLVVKGGDLTSSMDLTSASTNLAVELRLVMLILLHLQFVVVEASVVHHERADWRGGLLQSAGGQDASLT